MMAAAFSSKYGTNFDEVIFYFNVGLKSRAQ
jgi:hypothetical protein